MHAIQIVLEFIRDNYLFDDEFQINEDTDFFENGIIDSTGIIELVSFLEETFDITVNDDELVPENFSSLLKINNYLVNVKSVKQAV